MPKLRRLTGTLLLILSVAAMMATAVLAQSDDRIGDIRRQREQLARDAAEVASQVDALIADDDALMAALEDLDGYIGLQQTRIGAAEAAIVAAEAEAGAARAEADWLIDDLEAIRDRLRQRAIAAYVQPSVDGFDQLSSNTLNDGAVRMYLLDLAIGNELEIADELRTAEAQLEVVRRRALARAEEADRERQSQQQRLIDLEEARAAAVELRAEIQSRIDEWELVSGEIEQSDEEMEREIFRIEEEIRRKLGGATPPGGGGAPAGDRGRAPRPRGRARPVRAGGLARRRAEDLGLRAAGPPDLRDGAPAQRHRPRRQHR